MYPEIFLSKGVIIVEGRSEFGAIPEFAKKIPGVDLDGKGITIIQADGKDTIKYIYIILKKFTKCVAIRDNEDNNFDEELIKNENETYTTTKYRNFEAEIVNSVNILKLIKFIIKIDPEKAGGPYINMIRERIPETRSMDLVEIMSKWEKLKLGKVEINKDNLIKTLEDHFKTPLFWSLFAEEMTLKEVPECYKNIIINSNRIMT